MAGEPRGRAPIDATKVMDDPIRKTTETYDRVARAFLEVSRERGRDFDWLRIFASGLPKGARVLDLGAGPGRDAATFRELGVHAICLDLSLGMLREGKREYAAPRLQADFRSIPIRGSVLDGIWANASLLHVSRADFSAALSECQRVLHPKGHFFLSVKQGDGAEYESARYGHPRWFQYWDAAQLDERIRSQGFEIIDAVESRSADGTCWLARRCRSRGSRSA